MTLVVAGAVFLLLPASAALHSAPSTPRVETRTAGLTPARPAATTQPVVTPAPPPPAKPRIAEPRRLSIDAIGLSAEIITIGTDPSGVLIPPTNPGHVGWFTESSKPGEVGRAVLVGHLDSRYGPAVFARVPRLHPGDLVSVESADGAVHTFAVSTVTSHRKDAFPSEEVYGPTPDSELRLITCGGAYRKGFGYLNNVIVAASRVS
jgi:sortase (surface protein transpeptidase)